MSERRRWGEVIPPVIFDRIIVLSNNIAGKLPLSPCQRKPRAEAGLERGTHFPFITTLRNMKLKQPENQHVEGYMKEAQQLFAQIKSPKPKSRP